MTSGFYPDRTFKIWDYAVSHQQMVIRSLGPTGDSPNLDLHFGGVRFVKAPSIFRGLSLVVPTEEEVAEAQGLTAPRSCDRSMVWVLESSGHRHIVVAASLDIAETDFPMMLTRLIHPSHPDLS